MEKKLEVNYTRTLQAVMNKSWRQNSKTEAVQPPITYHENYLN